MNSRDNIQDELNDMHSDLPSHTELTPFAVPEGYFEGLASSVLSKIKGQQAPSASQEIAELSPLLATISRSMPYAVPSGYFQTTIEELPFLTAEDPQSAILSLVERITPYEVPTGYFEDLPEQVLNNVAPKAKVVPIIRRRWMRLAAAAMITGIMGLSGYFYFTQKGRLDADKPIAAQLKNVSIRELDDFIKTADIASSSTETAQRKAASETEVQKMLTSVSDRELDAFLSQVPADDLMFN